MHFFRGRSVAALNISDRMWITRSIIHVRLLSLNSAPTDLFSAIGQTIRDGNITASGRSSDDAFWYVIDKSIIQGNGSQTYLGRPWGDHARVVYQYCWLGNGLPAAAWAPWHTE